MINRKITLIIKPTNKCNLRCSYCYHYEKGYADDDVITGTELQTIFNLFKEGNIDILWHGGEPLLMGPDYFYQAIDLEKKYFLGGVKNRFQSNGTLIDRSYCTLFKSTHSSIGLSYDGLANDILRSNSATVLNAFELLKAEQIPFGIIHVITKQNIDYLKEDYEIYKLNKIHVKFKIVFPVNNLVNPDDIHFKELLADLLDLYDEWFFDTDCNISVSTFEQIIRMYFHASKECIYSSCLGKFLCIDPKMKLWPCGRNYPDKYCLGNVEDYSSIQEIFNSEIYKRILSESIDKRNWCMSHCKYYEYCHSGCINDSIISGNITEMNPSSCLYVRSFIDHTKSNMVSNRQKNKFISSFMRNVKWS